MIDSILFAIVLVVLVLTVIAGVFRNVFDKEMPTRLVTKEELKQAFFGVKLSYTSLLMIVVLTNFVPSYAVTIFILIAWFMIEDTIMGRGSNS